MEFMLTFQQPADVYERNADPDAGAPALHAWTLYLEAMQAAGVVRGIQRLDPFSTTTVRMRGGQRQVQDGPFADTKELLGGFVVIDVPSLDEALQWAARSPASQAGSTEVRPVLAMRPQ